MTTFQAFQRHITLLLSAIIISACGSGNTQQTELRVFAAASLTDAMTEIGAAFEAQNLTVSVIYNFAGSSTLATQITEGAAADVFLSANDMQAQNVIDAGLANGDPIVFVANQLVVAVPAANPGNITRLDDLTTDGLKIMTAAENVPIRVYTDTMLERVARQGFDLAQFRANIVSEETNVRQVVGKIALGEADAAIVYQSDVTPQIADEVTALDIIPAEANVRAAYPAVILQGAQVELAQTYLEFIQSDDAQSILAAWGFLPISSTEN